MKFNASGMAVMMEVGSHTGLLKVYDTATTVKRIAPMQRASTSRRQHYACSEFKRVIWLSNRGEPQKIQSNPVTLTYVAVWHQCACSRVP